MNNWWKEEDEMNVLIKVKLDFLIWLELDFDEFLVVVKDILNEYIGSIFEDFIYGEKLVILKIFVNNFLFLNVKEYVELIFYSYYLFYEKIIFEILVNWRNKSYLNFFIEGFINMIDYVIENGFILVWDGDIGGGDKDGFKDSGYVRVKGEYED